MNSTELLALLVSTIESEPDEVRRVRLLESLTNTAELTVTANSVMVRMRNRQPAACARGIHPVRSWIDDVYRCSDCRADLTFETDFV